jgi:hypothetical protein
MPLPQGLSLTSTGSIVGQPVAASAAAGGTDWTFTVRVVDANGRYAFLRDTIRVYPLPTVTVVAPAGTVGVAYTGSVTGSNGSSPYGYTVQSGALPTSVSLHATTGALSGTPTVAGTYTGTFRVTGDKGGIKDTAFSITIAA